MARRSLATVEPQTDQSKSPSAWAATLLASVLLAVLAVLGLMLAVYEYNSWQTARTASAIPPDYSPDTYLAAMLVSGVVGLLALGGLYIISSRWRSRRRSGAPEHAIR
jgi:hypothetical protein